MPYVPFSSPTAADKNPAGVKTGPQEQTASLSDGRQELEKSVVREFSQKGRITTEFLDKFATSHLDKEHADTPLAWDYAALRQTAQREESRRAQEAQQTQLARESAWTVKVGAALPDNASLQAYLDVQLPVHQAQLEKSGMTSQEAAGQIRHLRAQTVENHILRSLAANDWQTAQDVLTAQAGQLDAPVMARCAKQVRHSFAKQQAQALWQESFVQTGFEPQAAQAQALEKLQEPDEELKEDIRREIVNLSAQTVHQQALAQAGLFEQLAQANPEQKNQLLATQTLLNGHALDTVYQAAQQPEQPATAKQQAWFVKNYLNPPADLEQSFHDGLCAAKDYFRLKAVQQKSIGGQTPQTQQWLCRAIDTWMHKQGFSSQDIMQASYAVLGGSSEDEQIKIWQQIKNILTC